MLRNKIIYLLLVIYFIVFAILYNSYISLLVLIVFGAFPLLLLLYLIFTVPFITVSFEEEKQVIMKGETTYITISITNGSIFPVGTAQMVVYYGNSFEKDTAKKKVTVFVPGKKTQRIRVNFHVTHCGQIDVTCKKIRIFDYFKIFSFQKRQKVSTSILSIPQIYEIHQKLRLSPSLGMLEGDQYSKHKPGDDPSEVFRVRSYMEGDKLNRIHWKLSSKRNEYMVKDFSLPLVCEIAIVVDFYYVGTKKEIYSYIDALLETVYALSHTLLEGKQLHHIYWYDAKMSEVQKQLIKEEEDFYFVMESLLSSKVDTKADRFASYFYDMNRKVRYRKLYYISMNESSMLCETLAGENKHCDVRLISMISTTNITKQDGEGYPVHKSIILIEDTKGTIESLQL